MLVWLLALACGGGQRHPSTLIDTQIIAFEANPPEAQPDENVDLEITTVDPKGRGVEMLLWSCLLYEGLCVESQIAPVKDWAVVQRPEDGILRTSHRVPDEAWDLLQIADPIPTLLIALACPPDTCPIIDQVENLINDGCNPDPNQPVFDCYAGDELSRDLSDPSRWMSEVPVEGVSLVARVYPVSSASPGNRNENPTFETRFLAADDNPIELSRGEVLEMPFLVTDPNGETVYVFGYTTMGRFAERYARSEDNSFRHYLLAPDYPGEGEIFLVFEDGDGGSNLWRKRIRVK